jgi:hypothetical protein
LKCLNVWIMMEVISVLLDDVGLGLIAFISI